MPSAFNYDPTIISNIGCQLYNYFAYGMDALSPWCLVYISFEKFFSIKYISKKLMYKKKKYQIIFLIILGVFNILYRFNILFSFNLLTIDNSTICYFNNNENQIIIANMDLANFFLLPLLLMLLFSFLLISSIFKSRSRIRLNSSEREAKRLKKDIKLSISLLVMNLLFLLLNLPIVIDQFLPFNSDKYTIVSYIYYSSYAVNFYILLFTNSLFRKEFKLLFHKNRGEIQRNPESFFSTNNAQVRNVRQQIKT
jgi:hypothetical protein